MAVVRAVNHQDWDPREEPLLFGPSTGWDEHFGRAGCKCVGCLGGEEKHGWGAQRAALEGCPAWPHASGAPWDTHSVEPGHLPSEASFPLAGSKAFCPWAGRGSRLLWLGAALGSGRKVFSSLTISRFLFLRMVWSHVRCVAPCDRGDPAPAPWL